MRGIYDRQPSRLTPASPAQRRAWLLNALRARHVLISCTGPHAHTLKIRPPVVFTAAHVAQFLDALEGALVERC